MKRWTRQTIPKHRKCEENITNCQMEKAAYKKAVIDCCLVDQTASHRANWKLRQNRNKNNPNPSPPLFIQARVYAHPQYCDFFNFIPLTRSKPEWNCSQDFPNKIKKNKKKNSNPTALIMCLKWFKCYLVHFESVTRPYRMSFSITKDWLQHWVHRWGPGVPQSSLLHHGCCTEHTPKLSKIKKRKFWVELLPFSVEHRDLKFHSRYTLLSWSSSFWV